MLSHSRLSRAMTISRHTCMLLLPAMILTACGGGGGSSAPVVQPPPPPPATNSAINPLTETETFETDAVAASIDFDAGGTVTTSTTDSFDSGTGLTIEYLAASDSYRVRINDGGISSDETFAPADRVVDNSEIESFEKGDLALVLFKPGQVSGAIDLTYTSYGAWLNTQQSGGTTQSESIYFTYGVVTEPANLPTGPATYTGIVDGQMTDGNEFAALGGTMDMTANFTDGNITWDVSGQTQGLQTNLIRVFNLNGTGSLADPRNVFTGTLNGSVDVLNPVTGTFQGRFFGPAAEETSGTFSFEGGRFIGAGAFVGN